MDALVVEDMIVAPDAPGGDRWLPERAYRAVSFSIRELRLRPGQMVLQEEAADAAAFANPILSAG